LGSGDTAAWCAAKNILSGISGEATSHFELMALIPPGSCSDAALSIDLQRRAYTYTLG
jgi:hypothetical protein